MRLSQADFGATCLHCFSPFNDPDRFERRLYVQYWQNKLKSNKELDFPEVFADEIADCTAKFSFAYLKEVL